MKIVLVLLLPVLAFVFTGCNTLATRRDMYVEGVHQGEYTQKLSSRDYHISR